MTSKDILSSLGKVKEKQAILGLEHHDLLILLKIAKRKVNGKRKDRKDHLLLILHHKR